MTQRDQKHRPDGDGGATRSFGLSDTRAELMAALDRDDFTIDELVGRTEQLLRVLAPRQTRYKVTDRPDVRTIRYYTSQSLLPKPVGYAGGRARYGGTHLVRLLLIKKLQAEHQTLRQIARQLKDARDDHIVDALCSRASGSPAAPTPLEQPGDIRSVDRRALAAPVTGTPLRRIAVAPGCDLHVTEATLTDPAQRGQLADALQSLAARLRDELGETP